LLVDHRTYRIKPGHTQAHLKIYEQYGFAAQTRHLGQPIAYMYAESGDVNTVVHNWAYEDAADRTKRRAAMFAEAQRVRAAAGAEDLADDPDRVLPDQAVKGTPHRQSLRGAKATTQSPS
jgi:hypothetical protein